MSIQDGVLDPMPADRRAQELRGVAPVTGGMKGAQAALLGDAVPRALTELARA